MSSQLYSKCQQQTYRKGGNDHSSTHSNVKENQVSRNKFNQGRKGSQTL